jgi:hypothetical protein
MMQQKQHIKIHNTHSLPIIISVSNEGQHTQGTQHV